MIEGDIAINLNPGLHFDLFQILSNIVFYSAKRGIQSESTHASLNYLDEKI